MLIRFEEEFNTKPPERQELLRFVEENFEQEGDELMQLVYNNMLLCNQSMSTDMR